jgi:hypothetical protein
MMTSRPAIDAIWDLTPREENEHNAWEKTVEGRQAERHKIKSLQNPFLLYGNV